MTDSRLSDRVVEAALESSRQAGLEWDRIDVAGVLHDVYPLIRAEIVAGIVDAVRARGDGSGLATVVATDFADFITTEFGGAV